MCGEEYVYWDVAHIPPHCGSLKCKTNYEYQQSNVDRWGNKPTPEEIQGWTNSSESTKKSEKQS